MGFGSTAIFLLIQVGIVGIFSGATVQAQDVIALKGGESIELRNVYWVAQCRSIMIGLPEVEILEGPPEITLALKEAMVLPRTQKCAKPVPGGNLILTATKVAGPLEGKLAYRIKYRTKDGDRQTSRIYRVSIYP